MTALIIVFAVLALLALLLMFNVHIHGEYVDKPKLTIRYLFFKKIFEPKDKSKKQSSQNNKSKKKKKPKKEKKQKTKENPFKTTWEKDGISGFFDLLYDIKELVKSAFGGTLKYLKVRNIRVNVSIASDNAADTAVLYGTACSVVYPVVNLFTTKMNSDDYTVSVTANFDETAKSTVDADINIDIRGISALWIVITAGLKLLFMYIKLKKSK